MVNGGFGCDPGHDLVTYGYQGENADTFLATRDTYCWAGASLVLVSHQNKTIHGTPYSPELASTPEYRAAA